MTRKHKHLKKKQSSIDIDIRYDFIKRTVPNHVFNNTSQNPDYIAKYYEKKDNINFVLTNETKFTRKLMKPKHILKNHDSVTLYQYMNIPV